MLWWLIGLWLLSPALLPIVWLLGRLAPSGDAAVSPPSAPDPSRTS
jgi:hypothetical protein